MIVSLTIVRYRKVFVPFALLAMAVHRLPMRMQGGCTFWKLLGSGRNGTFDLQPDWQQWGLLAVWDDRDDYERFAERSFVSQMVEVFRCRNLDSTVPAHAKPRQVEWQRAFWQTK
jgi:hypothetical protein